MDYMQRRRQITSFEILCMIHSVMGLHFHCLALSKTGLTIQFFNMLLLIPSFAYLIELGISWYSIY